MRFSIFSALLSLSSVGLVAAQLSSCATACVSQAAAQDGCVSFTNITCVCTSAQFQQDARTCLMAQCSASDLTTLLGLQAQECGSQSLSATGTPTNTQTFTATTGISSGSGSASGSGSSTGSASAGSSTSPHSGNTASATSGGSSSTGSAGSTGSSGASTGSGTGTGTGTGSSTAPAASNTQSSGAEKVIVQASLGIGMGLVALVLGLF